jgi:S-adenosylmethionine-diacylglycerol 3-amino-3-carboxypropyl transferase
MFGAAATQHAEPGSYPRYFARAFERGLLRDDGAHNPFLQHVILGHYKAVDAPTYVAETPRSSAPPAIECIHGSLLDVPYGLERFGLISLSNVFDWSDDSLVASWAERLCRECRPGSAVLIRQLNNTRDVRKFFASKFAFDDALATALLARDRSLFYDRVVVGIHE